MHLVLLKEEEDEEDEEKEAEDEKENRQKFGDFENDNNFWL